MSRIETLKEKVKNLYLSKDPNRDVWADWMFKNHIFVVAGNAKKLAMRFGAKIDLAVAAAILHDVSDAVMRRDNDQHQQKSLEIATQYLTETGFDPNEINIVVNDAILFHSCHGKDSPQTIEGKVLATSDALAHLQNTFYELELSDTDKSMQEIRNWALPKIERDFQKKIFFPEIKNEVRVDYDRLKKLFVE